MKSTKISKKTTPKRVPTKTTIQWASPSGKLVSEDSLMKLTKAELVGMLSEYRQVITTTNNNAEYWFGLLREIGEAIGTPAFTNDDGLFNDIVLFDKLPSLVSEYSKYNSKPLVKNVNTSEHENVLMELNRTELIQSSLAWYETARLHAENETFYYNLLKEIGNVIGKSAFKCDDGSYSDTVLTTKLPELVKDLVGATEYLNEECKHITKSSTISADEFILHAQGIPSKYKFHSLLNDLKETSGHLWSAIKRQF